MVDNFMKRSQKNAKSRRGRYVKKCPVEVGTEYEVEIIDETPNGAGIARVKGFMVLVNGAKSGDNLKVRITQTDPLNAEAEIIN